MLDGKFKVVKLMVIILNIYIRKKGRWRKKKKKRERVVGRVVIKVGN